METQGMKAVTAWESVPKATTSLTLRRRDSADDQVRQRSPSADLLREPAATSGESHLETLAKFTSLSRRTPIRTKHSKEIHQNPWMKG